GHLERPLTKAEGVSFTRSRREGEALERRPPIPRSVPPFAGLGTSSVRSRSLGVGLEAAVMAGAFGFGFEAAVMAGAFGLGFEAAVMAGAFGFDFEAAVMAGGAFAVELEAPMWVVHVPGEAHLLGVAGGKVHVAHVHRA